MSRIPIAIGVGVFSLFVILSTLFVVDERQQAIIIRFGEIKRIVAEPGLQVKLPVLDQVIYVEDRKISYFSDRKQVQVVDGRRYVVDAILIYRITDPRRFRESVSADLRRLSARLETRLDAALREVYGARTFEDALSEERVKMMREIQDKITQSQKGQGKIESELGISIIDVRIKRTELLPEVLDQTYARMRAERLKEAEQLRAIGNQEALRIRAEADREATILVAEARRESEIVRGEGEGERAHIFAAAFTRDPEFFSFYRSMQAYKKGLDGNTTTMVLSPDSEFFNYFGDSIEGNARKNRKPSFAE